MAAHRITKTLIQFLLIFCFCLTPAGWSETVLTVPDFSGGLNVNSVPTRVAENQSSICTNWQLDDPTGALRLRPGYRYLTNAVSNYGRIWGLYGYKGTNLTPFLMGAQQRDDSNWCKIFISSAASFGITNEPTGFNKYIWPAPGLWMRWFSSVIYSDGVNEPKLINKLPNNSFTIDNVALSAPGQVETYILNQSGNLKGEYIYTTVAQIPCSAFTSSNMAWSSRCGILSKVVNPYNQKIALRNFYPMIADSECVAPDSIWVLILRTKANRGRDCADSFYVLDSLRLSNSRTDTIVYIDNKADASLGRIWNSIYKSQQVGFAQTNHNTIRKNYFYGGFTHITYDTGTPQGVFRPATGGAYMLYQIYLLDTITNRVSDTTPIMVWRPSFDTTNFTIGIPLAQNPGVVRVIVRSLVEQIVVGTNVRCRNQFSHPIRLIDTIYDSTQAVYFDTLSHQVWADSLLDVEHNVPYTIFKGYASHDGLLFAWDDSRVYVSRSDTLTDFSALDDISLDFDDGEPIVRCESFDNYLAVFKANSVWLLFSTGDDNFYGRAKNASGFGLVAKQAMVSNDGKLFYLTKDGVVNALPSAYKDVGIDAQYLSYPIRNILLRSIDSMKDAVAFNYDGKYLLSYPNTDSSFVYFQSTGGWGVWTFGFSAATMYDTLQRDFFQPFQNMVFTKPNDDRLFIFDDRDSNDVISSGSTVAITGTWEKRWMAPSLGTVTPANFWLRTDTTGDSTKVLTATFYNERGATLDQRTYNNLNKGFATSSVNNLRTPAREITLRLSLTGATPRTKIFGFSLGVEPTGR